MSSLLTTLLYGFLYACGVAALALCVADAYQRARARREPVQAKSEPPVRPHVSELDAILAECGIDHCREGSDA